MEAFPTPGHDELVVCRPAVDQRQSGLRGNPPGGNGLHLAARIAFCSLGCRVHGYRDDRPHVAGMADLNPLSGSVTKLAALYFSSTGPVAPPISIFGVYRCQHRPHYLVRPADA